MDKTYEILLEAMNRWLPEPQYLHPELKILRAMPIGGKPCPEQMIHSDYVLGDDFDVVKDAMPYSAVTAMHGDATSVTLVMEFEKTGKYIELVVPLLPGDMLLFGGNVFHKGRPYAMPNLRMFAYFPTIKYKPKDELTILSDVTIIK